MPPEQPPRALPLKDRAVSVEPADLATVAADTDTRKATRPPAITAVHTLTATVTTEAGAAKTASIPVTVRALTPTTSRSTRSCPWSTRARHRGDPA